MEEENKNIEKIEEETNANKSRLDNDNSKEQIGKLENIRDNTEKITSGLAEETDIYRLKEKQLIENLQNDRMLKTETLNFVRHIIWANIICTFAIITIVLFANLRFDKQVFSEQFLGVLLASQLIVVPLAVLKIIAKHLFPDK